MPPEEVREEEHLLVEAVSLLVQRQRETETWVAEQIWQAEERVASAERRYADLEARLMGIEDQLERLAHDLEPTRGDPAVDERLARLREQVEDLKSDPDARNLRPGPSAATFEAFSARQQASAEELPPGRAEGLRSGRHESESAVRGGSELASSARYESEAMSSAGNEVVPTTRRDIELQLPPYRNAVDRTPEAPRAPSRTAADAFGSPSRRGANAFDAAAGRTADASGAPSRRGANAFDAAAGRAADADTERTALRRDPADDGHPPVPVGSASGRSARAATAGVNGQAVTFMELLGSTPQDRYGLLLIAVGAVAVLYAILSRFI